MCVRHDLGTKHAAGLKHQAYEMSGRMHQPDNMGTILEHGDAACIVTSGAASVDRMRARGTVRFVGQVGQDSWRVARCFSTDDHCLECDGKARGDPVGTGSCKDRAKDKGEEAAQRQ